MDAYNEKTTVLNKDTGEKKSVSRWAKLVPLFICGLFIIFCALFAKNVEFEDVMNYTPHNVFLAAIVLWGFYAVKSLSVMIPATIFFLAAGHIYPYWAAVAVNIVGLSVSFTIPYFLGRFSGSELVDAVIEKYPKAKRIVEYGHENNFFTVYASRAITVVPNDLVSMLHGSLKMPFPSYMLGSVIGLLPEMLVETYIGGKLSQLTFRSFLVMLGLIAMTAVLSFALNKKISRIYHKKHDENDKDN